MTAIEIILLSILGILILVFFIIPVILSLIFSITLTLGMREKQFAFYDPEIKQWIPYSLLNEEQLSRIVDRSRKLSKRNSNETNFREELNIGLKPQYKK